MQAIILAAGTGSRIPHITKHKPKGFILLGDKTLIEMSLDKLIKHGIKDIRIVAGYKSEFYENLAKKYNGIVSVVKNEDYEITGSMHSLYVARNDISKDFLLLESDILYDEAGIEALLTAQQKDVVLASGTTNSGDEVYIEVDKNSFLVNVSKKSSDLASIHSEFTGLNKISISTYEKMCLIYEENSDRWSDKLEYEQFAIRKVSEFLDFYVLKIDDYLWCEIDEVQHLERAKKYIYPSITKKENERSGL